MAKKTVITIITTALLAFVTKGSAQNFKHSDPQVETAVTAELTKTKKVAETVKATETVDAAAKTIELTLADALQILNAHNNTIKQADNAVEMAKATNQKLNALWFPHLSASGMYAHMSQNIESRNNMGKLISEDGNVLTPIKEALGGSLPTSQELAGILEKLFPHLGQEQIIGIIQKVGTTINEFASALSASTLTVPIIDKNVASMDVMASWPVFTGGKRIFSSKIGKLMIEQAENLRDLTYDNQTLLLINAYYTLKLSMHVVEVKEENVKTMTLLYNDALKLKDAGMINKAELLTAQVAAENAAREFESAKNSVSVVDKAIKNLLKIDDSTARISLINPVTDYANTTNLLPDEEYFNNLVHQNSKALKAIELKKSSLKNQRKIAASGYMPNVAVFAKQNLYSYHLPGYISPKTVLGAGLSWNLFDGLSREANIKLADKAITEAEITKDKTYDQITLGVRSYLTQAEDAMYNLKTLQTTLQLCNELIEIRQKSFKEGMSTANDVVTAQTALSNAKLATSLAKYQYSVSLANLMVICGIGYEFVESVN